MNGIWRRRIDPAGDLAAVGQGYSQPRIGWKGYWAKAIRGQEFDVCSKRRRAAGQPRRKDFVWLVVPRLNALELDESVAHPSQMIVIEYLNAVTTGMVMPV